LRRRRGRLLSRNRDRR